jgi:hypothetical protein
MKECSLAALWLNIYDECVWHFSFPKDIDPALARSLLGHAFKTLSMQQLLFSF